MKEHETISIYAIYQIQHVFAAPPVARAVATTSFCTNGTTKILGYADDLDLVADKRETDVSRNAEILIEAVE